MGGFSLKISLRTFLMKAYIILTLFIVAFVNTPEATGFLYDMIVPYINIPTVIMHSVVLIGISFLFFMFGGARIKFDVIAVCLLIKVFLDAIPLVTGNAEFMTYFQHYMCTVVAFFSYEMFINTSFSGEDFGWIKKAIAGFGVVLTAQVLFTYFVADLTIGMLMYKQHMVIPYGGTNIIASILVPLLCLAWRSQWRKSIKIVLCGWYLIGIILTKSTGGWLLGFLTVTYLLYTEDTVNKKIDKNKRKIINSFLIIAITLVVLFNPVFQEVIDGKISRAGGNVAEGLANGRISLWKASLDDLARTDILFGYGMQSIGSDATGGAGAHNIFIDLMLKCGVIGTINYLLLFGAMVKRGSSLYKQNGSCIFLMIVVMYVNSLFEVCYFTYACDTMLWLFIGVMMSEYYSHKKLRSTSKRNLREMYGY